MKSQATQHLVQVIIMLFVFLVGNYFLNFASRPEVHSEVQRLDSKIDAVDKKTEASMDKVLTALCIINDKTCAIREK